jgi:hypothetical protein
MPRFAVLIHDSPRGLHFDFFLEDGKALKTWAFPPPLEAGIEIQCTALEDHRPIYLDYEGPISGDRGSVVRWDRGTYEIETWNDGEVIVAISGTKLAGRVELRRQANSPDQWRLMWTQ